MDVSFLGGFQRREEKCRGSRLSSGHSGSGDSVQVLGSPEADLASEHRLFIDHPLEGGDQIEKIEDGACLPF